MADVQQWEAAGVRVELVPSRPRVRLGKDDRPVRTQAWDPPHLALSYVGAPCFEDPRAVLAVIDVLATAGLALQEALADYTPGVLL